MGGSLQNFKMGRGRLQNCFKGRKEMVVHHVLHHHHVLLLTWLVTFISVISLFSRFFKNVLYFSNIT